MLELLYYALIALIVVLPATTVACGQWHSGQTALDAINTQPQAKNDIFRAYILGSALNEMAAIMSTIMGAFLLFLRPAITLEYLIALMGIIVALVIPSCLVGYLSAKPQQTALASLARQPFLGSKIVNLMILTISMMQMSVILGLFISFLIQKQLSPALSLLQALQLFAIGLTFGGGSIGPLIGMSNFTETACGAVGRYPHAYGNILSLSFISPALIETPILFSLGVALFIMFRTPVAAAPLLAAALTMTLTTFGPGIGSGRVAASACRQIALQPARSTEFTYVSMLVQTLIDASVIYGLIIAIILIVFGN